MVTTGDPVANLRQNNDLLNQILRGDADEDVIIDGVAKPTLSKVAAQYAANHGIYPTVDEGLAAVGEGGVFAVPGEDDETYLSLYRNLDGQANKIVDAPSSTRLSEVTELVRRTDANRVCAQITDSLGFALWVAMADGGFGTPNAYISPTGIALDGVGKYVTIRDGEFVLAEWGDHGLNTEISPSIVGPSKDGSAMTVWDAHGFLGMRLGNETFEAHGLSAMADGDGGDGGAGTALTPVAYPRPPKTKVVAHRGVHLNGIAPENSLDAYRYAGMFGYRYVETDILVTSDGQFVVMHDDTINRTMRNASDYSTITDSVAVKEHTLAELRTNYVMEASYPAQRKSIPTLQEFLKTCRDFDLYPVIELKNREFTDAEIDAITEICLDYFSPHDFAYCAFNADQLDYVRTINPDIELWYIQDRSVAQLAAVAPAVWYSRRSAISADLVSECHRAGVGVGCWTANNDEFQKFVNLLCDYTATNSIAPETPNGQPLYAIRDLQAMKSDGMLTSGVLQLSAGQTMTLPQSITNDGARAAYLRMEAKGDFSVNANQMDLSYSYSNWQDYHTQMLVYIESPYLTVTAGESGAQIRAIEYTVVHLI